MGNFLRFQSLSRDSGRLNRSPPRPDTPALPWFQSLSRDSGRLNRPRGRPGASGQRRVSIPQSGFGAFELLRWAGVGGQPIGFQSLSRDSGRLNLLAEARERIRAQMFQSLSRDSGRLNCGAAGITVRLLAVSIPQSGFGAFELAGPGPGGEHDAMGVSIPQSGFGAFEPHAPGPGIWSQQRVSIPQSGFGAFEPRQPPTPFTGGRGFNPSVGIRGV